MSKILFCMIFAVFLVGIQPLYAADTKQKNYNVDITTSGAVALPASPDRKWALLINPSTSYIVWIATAPITSSNYNTVGSISIGPNHGKYEDNFWVYKSTWYAASESGTIKISVSEKK